MPEIEEKEKTDIPKAEQERGPESAPEESFKFPTLSKGPALFYENDKKEVWLGIPFDQVNNPNFVMAALDRAKYDVLNHLAQYQQEQMRKAALQQSPAGQKFNRSLKDLLGLGKSKPTIVAP